MCGIAGFYHATRHYLDKKEYAMNILNDMTKILGRRGPNDNGTYLSEHFGLAHTRLSIIDLHTGHQPISCHVGDDCYTIVYNGELYNTEELRQELTQKGYCFQTTSDAEVPLLGFLAYGPDFVTRLNGIFAYAIISERDNALYLFRDRLGVKPLFYAPRDGEVIFSSEPKGLFAHPLVKPQLDRQGLNEIFSLGPAKTPGSGVFKEVYEVLPGHYIRFDAISCTDNCYWSLKSQPHTDTYEETLEKTRFLVTDAIKRQMVSDVPICTFLSGGVDSSVVSAVCASVLREKQEQLHTYSFDFVDNDRYFQSNSFQPSRDRPYVDIMKDYLNSAHQYLECSKETQADLLYDSVCAHDLPAMADIDSSMLYFCSIVGKQHKVVLTGECADEIFGGYPWFHKAEMLARSTFPWTPDLTPRQALLTEDFREYLHMEDYVQNAYYKSIAEVTSLPKDTAVEKKRREISYLNLRWFMQTLLDRMDRTSMYSGLEARVPFADYRIVEYLYQVPWAMKAKDGLVKGLLRNACKGLLPEEILFRQKSPYPKTYDPHYENLLAKRLRDVLSDSHAPVLQFIDKKKTLRFLESPSDYGKPWYGQLMAGPQLTAYLLQINYWLTHYQIEVLL